MRTGVFIATSCILCSVGSHSLSGGEPERPQRSIVLSSEDILRASFGRVLLLKVCYQNLGDTPWTVTTPEVSSTTRLWCRRAGSEGPAGGYHLGKAPSHPASYYKDGDKLSGVAGEPMVIPAGESHSFMLPLEQGWTGNLTPGLWDVWIRDSDADLTSNHLQIPLRFTTDSIAVCLEIVTDRKWERNKRDWHAAWLRRMMPGLDIRWWSPIDPPEDREKAETEIAQKLDDFRTFLRDPENAEAIQQAIARINREAGLPPVADQKPVETPAPQAGQ